MALGVAGADQAGARQPFLEEPSGGRADGAEPLEGHPHVPPRRDGQAGEGRGALIHPPPAAPSSSIRLPPMSAGFETALSSPFSMATVRMSSSLVPTSGPGR